MKNLKVDQAIKNTLILIALFLVIALFFVGVVSALI